MKLQKVQQLKQSDKFKNNSQNVVITNNFIKIHIPFCDLKYSYENHIIAGATHIEY